jgi:hypothetical protein
LVRLFPPMKIRRLAALALAVLTGCAQTQTGPGWLLVLPPLNAGGYADKAAPLSKWQTFGTYSGPTDCNSAIQSNQMAVISQVSRISRAAVPSETLPVQMMSSECVAGDDPRLKAN